MSTPNPQPASASPAVPAAAPAPKAAPAASSPGKREILVVSHCSLFYWWPVWAVGFLMWLVTAFTGEYMVTVPTKTEAKREGAVVLVQGKNKNDPQLEEKRDAYVLPSSYKLPPAEPGKALGAPNPQVLRQ